MTAREQIAKLEALLARIRERGVRTRASALEAANGMPPPPAPAIHVEEDGPQTVRGFSMFGAGNELPRHAHESWSLPPSSSSAPATERPPPPTDPPFSQAPATDPPPSNGPATERPAMLDEGEEVPVYVEPVVALGPEDVAPPDEQSRPRIIDANEALAREQTMRGPLPVFDEPTEAARVDRPPASEEPSPDEPDELQPSESGVLVEEAPVSSQRPIADVSAMDEYRAPMQTLPPESGRQVALPTESGKHAALSIPAEPEIVPEVTHADLRPGSIGFEQVGEPPPARVPTFAELLEDSLDL